MAYLAVNRDGEELIFNECPIYDRVEDTWKVPMIRWDKIRDDDYGITLPKGTIEILIGGPLSIANEPVELKGRDLYPDKVVDY